MEVVQRCIRRVCTGSSGAPKKFGFWVSVCYAINVIIGSGFLAIPYGVTQAGLVLGCVSVIVAVWLCDISKDFLLEVMGRAEAISAGTLRNVAKEEDYGSTGNSTPAISREEPLKSGASASASASASSTNIKKTSAYEKYSQDVRDSFIEEDRDTDSLLANNELSKATFHIRERRFETPELCELFIGKPMKYIYLVLFCCWMVGTLWSFTAVFSSSMASNIPVVFLSGKNAETCDINEDECFPQYISFLVIFAMLVIPLSLMDMEEQLFLQVALAVGRVVVMLTMVVTVFVGFGCDEVAFEDVGSERSVYKTLVRWKGVPVLLPIAITTAIFHHTIPGIADSTEDKTRLSSVFRYAFFIVGFCYAGIGIILSMYFGSDVDSQANIHWSSYYGCTNEGESRPSIAKAIGDFVLIFPPLDVVSVFPLGAIALGNSLLSMRFPQSSLRSRSDTVEEPGQEVDIDSLVHIAQYKHWKRCTRLIACGPPIIGAIFEHDLGTILQVNGTIGIAIAMTIPALLWQFSTSRIAYENQESKLENGDSATTVSEEPTGTPREVSMQLLDSSASAKRKLDPTSEPEQSSGRNEDRKSSVRSSSPLTGDEVIDSASEEFVTQHCKSWMNGPTSTSEAASNFLVIAFFSGRLSAGRYESVYSSWCTRFRYLPAIFFGFSLLLYVVVLVFVATD